MAKKVMGRVAACIILLIRRVELIGKESRSQGRDQWRVFEHMEGV